MRRSAAGWIGFGLVAVGAANWGLKGFFGRDLVSDALGGQRSFLTRTVYKAVGIAGLYMVGEAIASILRPDPWEEFMHHTEPELRELVAAPSR